MPFTPVEENIKLFYKYPDFIEKAHEHVVFTENFNQIGLSLKNSRIIFYGIQKKSMTPHIQTFVYDKDSDVYREIQTSETLPMFKSEIDKQIERLR